MDKIFPSCRYSSQRLEKFSHQNHRYQVVETAHFSFIKIMVHSIVSLLVLLTQHLDISITYFQIINQAPSFQFKKSSPLLPMLQAYTLIFSFSDLGGQAGSLETTLVRMGD